MIESLTPREIVSELDRYIVGQDKAKKAVAVALRNRWRRQQVPEDLRDEIAPKNILMIGPTGVGKTEIARRLAKLAQAPFIKVEASKFTEVGYVGRDVESMVRDLVETAITLVRTEHQDRVKARALKAAEEQMLDVLLRTDGKPLDSTHDRETYRRILRSGDWGERLVEVQVQEKVKSPLDGLSNRPGMEEMGINLSEMFGQFMPRRKRTAKLKVREAMRSLEEEEASKLIDQEAIVQEALHRAQHHGIIFLDEIDKIASRAGGQGPDVSREGVQRDLLPIVEGSQVNTKHGVVHTDHILFVAAGAFHLAKPSDLIPELQGRFPIRVELEALGVGDFVRILQEPKNSLLRQYAALMATEGVTVTFRDDAVEELARWADSFNTKLENIGARRLHTILERVFEDIAFHAPDMHGTQVEMTPLYVQQRLQDVVEDIDLSRYIL